MKQVTGFFIIILAIPSLFVIHGAIATELRHADSLNKQVATSIELSVPDYHVPIIMKDRNGLVFSEEYVEWRNPLPLSDIPIIARQLFLDSEDTGFYEHRGYDIAAIVRAFMANATQNSLSQGGSTITQQLVRMQFLSTEKTYERKLTELFYAAELEKQLDKDDILEMYLNEMYFGNKVYGIGAAATYYFNRPLADLNQAEIAFIAAIPNNPTLYDPLTHFDATKERQERLLDILVKNNRVTKEQATIHKNAPIQLSIKKKVNRFPAYSTYVLSELEELIATAEGFEERLKNVKNIDDEKT